MSAKWSWIWLDEQEIRMVIYFNNVVCADQTQYSYSTMGNWQLNWPTNVIGRPAAVRTFQIKKPVLN